MKVAMETLLNADVTFCSNRLAWWGREAGLVTAVSRFFREALAKV